MKLYISGPMTGMPELNFPAFREAAAALTKAGYDVLDPSRNFGGRTNLPRADYMREDISNVLRADGLALLEGWRRSTGAKLERSIALELGLPCYGVQYWLDVNDLKLPLERIANGGTVLNDGEAGQAETKTETILEEAQRLVHGDRGAAYGHPADDFGRTAEYWTTTFKAKLRPGERFTAGDVPLALIGVKLSREVNKPKRDNMTDLAGYAETRRMVLERGGVA